MQAKLMNNDTGRSFVLVLDPEEEVMGQLLAFVGGYNLNAGHFTAIGGFRRAVLGFWDVERRDFDRITVDEQVEVLNLSGNISLYEGEPRVHAHVVLGKRDGTAVGGHLLEAVVRPTLEVLLMESPEYLQRSFDVVRQLPLLRLERTVP